MSDDSGQRSNAANLGCGTLIIIALIVLFVGRADTTMLEQQNERLLAEVESLQNDVEILRREQAQTHRLLESLVLTVEPVDAGKSPDADEGPVESDANTDAEPVPTR